MTTLRAVRLDADGTLTDLSIPIGDEQTSALHQAIGCPAEIAHWTRRNGTRRLALALPSGADAARLPANLYATSLVSAVRRSKLPHALHGPVVLLGAASTDGDLTDLPESLHAALPDIVAALKTRYAPAA